MLVPFSSKIPANLILVIQKILISNNIHRENSSLLWKIERYVCSLGASWRYHQNKNVCIIIYYYYYLGLLYYYYCYYFYSFLLFRNLYCAPLRKKKKENRLHYLRCGKWTTNFKSVSSTTQLFGETKWKKKSLIFLSIKKGKSSEKGQMHLTITWIEGIPFLRVYLTTFIAKQGTIFKDIRYKQNAQYCSICSSNDLICYLLWQTSHLEDRDHARIAIIYNEVFTYFFFRMH